MPIPDRFFLIDLTPRGVAQAGNRASEREFAANWGVNPVGVLIPPRYVALMNTSDIKDKGEELANQAQDWKETAQQWQQAAAIGS